MLSVVKDAIEKSPVDGLIYLAKNHLTLLAFLCQTSISFTLSKTLIMSPLKT